MIKSEAISQKLRLKLKFATKHFYPLYPFIMDKKKLSIN